MTQSGNKVRDLVLELWTRTRIDWGFATDRIADAFRQRRDLGSSERREVAETLYGMIRQARRIDYALERLGTSTGNEREFRRYLAYRLMNGEMTVAEAKFQLARDWGSLGDVNERIAKERNPMTRFALEHSLPDWLAQRLMDEYGDEAPALAAALNVRAPLCVRANTLKITREALRERLVTEGVEAHPTKYAPNGLVLDTRVNVFGLAAFKEGLFETQDEASQIVAELVAPPPKGLVVDACAGAGGKTLAIGAMLANKGRVVALDVDERKLEELRRRARRAGLTTVRAIAVEADRWPDEVEAFRGKADRVLVDAPCSGMGALRRNPEARWRLTEVDLERLPIQQLAIARRAMDHVAPGGRLIYATCTILRAENEDVVEKLLGSVTGWEVVRAAEIWGTERASWITDVTGTYVKLRPNRHDTDGFFGAVLRRKR